MFTVPKSKAATGLRMNTKFVRGERSTAKKFYQSFIIIFTFGIN